MYYFVSNIVAKLSEVKQTKQGPWIGRIWPAGHTLPIPANHERVGPSSHTNKNISFISVHSFYIATA